LVSTVHFIVYRGRSLYGRSLGYGVSNPLDMPSNKGMARKYLIYKGILQTKLYYVTLSNIC
jgi:hypothetical protein